MHGGSRCPFQRERLKYDGAFRTEVGYCAENGIPHKEFLARWDPEDRAKLVAYMLEKSDRCTMCGTADWEWLADPDCYRPVTKQCIGCQLKERHRQGEGDQNMPGRSVVLIPRAEAERLLYDPTVQRHGPRVSRRPRRQQ